MNAGGFVGRFSAGAVLPYVGTIDLTITSTVICAILIIGMIWLRSVVSVVVLGVLYGLFSGMNVAMMAPMLGLTSDPAELGVRMGVGFAITGTSLIHIFLFSIGSLTLRFGLVSSPRHRWISRFPDLWCPSDRPLSLVGTCTFLWGDRIGGWCIIRWRTLLVRPCRCWCGAEGYKRRK
ncbi:hypothetical protein HD554DRAFT_807059 [Boletus coccyginus]|nr:hypothetical protein HD554DRAFT_807059 [Boletus coccyginus]